ncbi:MAG TPA: FAD-dependent oxidoreductase [Polyangiales bacterium]|nr:FAD-dependent oxidoreductase [Polyangiales bacterium]
MRKKIVIVGGGIAGLTAAHELVERGYEVHLYERRSHLGGKASSQRVGPARLPGEHGFRFFPGWYRHLPDTMKRIPYRGSRDHYQHATVFDNLVSIDAGLLAWSRREQVRAPMHVPRSADQALDFLGFVRALSQLDLAPGEVLFFLRKLGEYLAMPENERVRRLEAMSWWEYLDADNKSPAFRDLIAATTRSMIAARAEVASAYTIGRLAARTLFDALSSVDRVLNGPTQEVWIEPWVRHLTGLGVRFHLGRELTAIEISDTDHTVRALRFENVMAADLRRISRALDRLEACRHAQEHRPLEPAIAERASKHAAEQEKLELHALRDLARKIDGNPRDRLDARYAELAADLRNLVAANAGPDAIERARGVLEVLQDEIEPHELVQAAHFVLALPVEQLAYYVNRSAALKQADPGLRSVIELAEHVEWMAGIQFYLKTPLDISEGHIVFMDSEWSLTAIEHTQFWRDTDTGEHVAALLSVDISAWDVRGRFDKRPAFNCDADQIAAEVWEQLKAALNREGRQSQLRDDMLLNGPKLRSAAREAHGNYYLDDSIAERFERVKQAAYEKARSVSPDRSAARRATSGDAPYIWGPRLNYNIEPLLVNRAGTRSLRPRASTRLPNLFLAGDYVLTETDLACMEGANEAARHAVNALLDRESSRESRCPVWRFTVADQVRAGLETLGEMSGGFGFAMGAARSFGTFASGLLDLAGRAAQPRRRGRR